MLYCSRDLILKLKYNLVLLALANLLTGCFANLGSITAAIVPDSNPSITEKYDPIKKGFGEEFEEFISTPTVSYGALADGYMLIRYNAAGSTNDRVDLLDTSTMTTQTLASNVNSAVISDDGKTVHIEGINPSTGAPNKGSTYNIGTKTLGATPDLSAYMEVKRVLSYPDRDLVYVHGFLPSDDQQMNIFSQKMDGSNRQNVTKITDSDDKIEMPLDWGDIIAVKFMDYTSSGAGFTSNPQVRKIVVGEHNWSGEISINYSVKHIGYLDASGTKKHVYLSTGKTIEIGNVTGNSYTSYGNPYIDPIIRANKMCWHKYDSNLNGNNYYRAIICYNPDTASTYETTSDVNYTSVYPRPTYSESAKTILVDEANDLMYFERFDIAQSERSLWSAKHSDGTNLQKITLTGSDHFMSHMYFSPDKKKIVIDRMLKEQTISVVNLDTSSSTTIDASDPEFVTNGTPFINENNFSSDSKYFAVHHANYSQKKARLLVINLETATIHHSLPDYTEKIDAILSYSSDNKTLYYGMNGVESVINSIDLEKKTTSVFLDKQVVSVPSANVKFISKTSHIIDFNSEPQSAKVGAMSAYNSFDIFNVVTGATENIAFTKVKAYSPEIGTGNNTLFYVLDEVLGNFELYVKKISGERVKLKEYTHASTNGFTTADEMFFVVTSGDATSMIIDIYNDSGELLSSVTQANYSGFLVSMGHFHIIHSDSNIKTINHAGTELSDFDTSSTTPIREVYAYDWSAKVLYSDRKGEVSGSVWRIGTDGTGNQAIVTSGVEFSRVDNTNKFLFYSIVSGTSVEKVSATLSATAADPGTASDIGDWEIYPAAQRILLVGTDSGATNAFDKKVYIYDYDSSLLSTASEAGAVNRSYSIERSKSGRFQTFYADINGSGYYQLAVVDLSNLTTRVILDPVPSGGCVTTTIPVKFSDSETHVAFENILSGYKNVEIFKMADSSSQKIISDADMKTIGGFSWSGDSTQLTYRAAKVGENKSKLYIYNLK